MGDTVSDLQVLFNILAGLLITILGWLGRTLWDDNRELRKQMADQADKCLNQERLIADNYLRNEVFHQYIAAVLNPINESLKRIENKLDGKADKQ